MKVIIVRPNGYSGGSLVLEKMCSLLRVKGIDARIFHVLYEPEKDTKMVTFWLEWLVLTIKVGVFYVLCKCFPKSTNKKLMSWRPLVMSPVKGVKRKVLPFFSKKNTIVIYPEKVYGNFLHANNVVRFLLYHYAYADDKNAYCDSDLFVAFREVFNNKILNKNGYVVTINHFDKELYRQYNYNKRKGTCYIIRKGKNRTDLPKKFDGPIIDDLPEDEKVKVFNECERCYSYDTQTFYTSIAAVCGCLPIVVLEEGKKRKDYFDSSEFALGVAYGESDDEINYALNTREQLNRSLNFDASNEKSIGLFIEILKKTFNL